MEPIEELHDTPESRVRRLIAGMLTDEERALIEGRLAITGGEVLIATEGGQPDLRYLPKAPSPEEQAARRQKATERLRRRPKCKVIVGSLLRSRLAFEEVGVEG